ncbi:MAG: hypothetical protein GX434_08390 [Peptococcaceae bacterium]|nr:hypothetical protein [Peptococcaceae bacterium]
MTLPGKQSVESFLFNLSLAAGGVVLLFSVFNGYTFMMIVIRTALSFFFMFFLGKGFLVLWDKFSPPPVKKEPNYGSAIDVLLGDINAKGMKGTLYNSGGIISEDVEKSPEEQNEEPVSAGTYGGSIPGQISMDMKNGLQDAGTKAEIVRRMGWGEEQ